MIDWTHYTPWASLAGGILIGAAAAMLVLFNGRISGIVGGLLVPRRGEIGWRLAFVAGLLAAPALYVLLGEAPPARIEAGFGTLVAFGAGHEKAAVFVAAMLGGMLLYAALERLIHEPRTRRQARRGA